MSGIHEASRWLRPGRVIPIFLLILVIFGAIGFRIASTSGVKRDVERLRERGLPVDPVALDAWYSRVPATNNAALGFIEAYALFVAPATGNDPYVIKIPVVPGEPLHPELAEAAARFVEKNEPAITAMHQAARLTASRYPVDLTKGYATLLPHLAHLKRMAQLLKWDAIHKSAGGDREGAIESLASAFALAHSLHNEPIMISELVRIACLSISMVAVEHVISQQPVADAHLVRLMDAFQQAEEDGRRGLQRAINGERGSAIPVFNWGYRDFLKLDSSGTVTDPAATELFKATLFTFRRALGFQNRDLAFFLRHMATFEKTVQMDFPEMLLEGKKADESMQSELGRHWMKFSISGMLLPAMQGTARKEAILTARLRCARVALAVERYRLLHNGKFPSADELIPAFLPSPLRDPVDNATLRYETTDPKGFRIAAPAATALLRQGSKSTNLTEIAFTVAR